VVKSPRPAPINKTMGRFRAAPINDKQSQQYVFWQWSPVSKRSPDPDGWETLAELKPRVINILTMLFVPTAVLWLVVWSFGWVRSGFGHPVRQWPDKSPQRTDKNAALAPVDGPSVRLPYQMYLTGKQRLSTVIALAWVVFNAFAFEPWRYTFPNGDWKPFLIYGIAPIATVVAILWIRGGFKNDRERNT
jgi:hypothetical protein